MQFADSASGVWTVIIAVNVLLIVVANYRETDKFGTQLSATHSTIST
jgi:hypothetical protein